MKNYLWVVVIGLAAFAAGCTGPPVAVEHSKVCAAEFDRKYVEVVGFFNNTGSAMCSKRGSEPMYCPVDFVETAGGTMPILTNLYKGSGNSSIDNPEEKGLKIKDDKGGYVENNEKVKITGTVMFFTGTQDPNAKYRPCSIKIDKIDKVQ